MLASLYGLKDYIPPQKSVKRLFLVAWQPVLLYGLMLCLLLEGRSISVYHFWYYNKYFLFRWVRM